MTEPLQERDAMRCRSCGNEERASEGYPCAGCGTFICQICEMKGVQYCQQCTAQGLASRGTSATIAPDGAAPGRG